jgi:hypothetical protein
MVHSPRSRRVGIRRLCGSPFGNRCGARRRDGQSVARARLCRSSRCRMVQVVDAAIADAVLQHRGKQHSVAAGHRPSGPSVPRGYVTPYVTWSRRCLHRVKRIDLTMRRSLPVYPHQPTSLVLVGMIQRCQKRKAEGRFVKVSDASAKASIYFRNSLERSLNNNLRVFTRMPSSLVHSWSKSTRGGSFTDAWRFENSNNSRICSPSISSTLILFRA